LVAEARARLNDASPLVRGAAVWALGQLLPKEEFIALRQETQESDPGVRMEWAGFPLRLSNS
jgi:epoxyqueuosine reductase